MCGQKETDGERDLKQCTASKHTIFGFYNEEGKITVVQSIPERSTHQMLLVIAVILCLPLSVYNGNLKRSLQVLCLLPGGIACVLHQ